MKKSSFCGDRSCGFDAAVADGYRCWSCDDGGDDDYCDPCPYHDAGNKAAKNQSTDCGGVAVGSHLLSQLLAGTQTIYGVVKMVGYCVIAGRNIFLRYFLYFFFFFQVMYFTIILNLKKSVSKCDLIFYYNRFYCKKK